MTTTAAPHDAHVHAWLSTIVLDRIMGLARYGDGGCWLWFGACNSRAGRSDPRAIPVMALPNRGKQGISVRRIAARIAGLNPVGQQIVLTTCGQQLCVNPEHMRVATRRQMVREAVRDGRIKTGHTSSFKSLAAARRNPHVKLTLDLAREMRVRYAAGESAAALGREYGISPQHAHRVCTGVWWRDSSPLPTA